MIDGYFTGADARSLDEVDPGTLTDDAVPSIIREGARTREGAGPLATRDCLGLDEVIERVTTGISGLGTTVEVVRRRAGGALIKGTPTGTQEQVRSLCALTKHLLRGPAGASGGHPFAVVESVCSARGADCCLYTLVPDRSSVPQDRSASGPTRKSESADGRAEEAAVPATGLVNAPATGLVNATETNGSVATASIQLPPAASEELADSVAADWVGMPESGSVPAELADQPVAASVPAELADQPVAASVPAELADQPLAASVPAELADLPVAASVPAELADLPAPPVVPSPADIIPQSSDPIAETPAGEQPTGDLSLQAAAGLADLDGVAPVPDPVADETTDAWTGIEPTTSFSHLPPPPPGAAAQVGEPDSVILLPLADAPPPPPAPVAAPESFEQDARQLPLESAAISAPPRPAPIPAMPRPLPEKVRRARQRPSSSGRRLRLPRWVTRRGWLVLLTVVAALGGGWYARSGAPVTYSAQAVVVVQAGATRVSPGSANEAGALATTYAALVPVDTLLLDAVARTLGVTPAAVQKNLSVTVETGTSILLVSYTSQSATTAVRASSDVAQILATQPQTSAIPKGTIVVVRLPSSASQSGLVHKYALPAAGGLGLFLGIIILIAAERADPRIDDSRHLAACVDCPTVAVPLESTAGELARALAVRGASPRSGLTVVPISERGVGGASELTRVLSQMSGVGPAGADIRQSEPLTGPVIAQSLVGEAGATVLAVAPGDKASSVRSASQRLAAIGRPPVYAVLVGWRRRANLG